jgi:glycosyltransferase involved in cell wall biosynthesis
MARVLWYGDVGNHSGFARVTHAIANRLVFKGHDVHVLGLNYPGDWSHETENLKIYKADARDPRQDMFGTKRIAEVITRVEPDVIVFLHDPAALVQLLFSNRSDPQRLLLNYCPVLAYLPVDGYDYPIEWTETISATTNVIAMSRHGQAMFPGSKLVYHGIDQESFWPVSEDRPIWVDDGPLESKADCKRFLGYDPERILIARVDTNSGRKDYASLIHALAPVLARHDDIDVHLHAGTDPQMPGVNLAVLISRYGLGSRITVTDPVTMLAPWGQTKLNILDNAADYVVSTSRGEGFGLGLVEALACGTPVIAQNVSAIPEVVGPGGILLEPQRRITTPAGQDTWLCDVEAFSEAIERLYESVDLRIALGQFGYEHVISSFSWEYAADRFDTYIDAAARWTGPEAPVAVQQHE